MMMMMMMICIKNVSFLFLNNSVKNQLIFLQHPEEILTSETCPPHLKRLLQYTEKCNNVFFPQDSTAILINNYVKNSLRFHNSHRIKTMKNVSQTSDYVTANVQRTRNNKHRICVLHYSISSSKMCCWNGPSLNQVLLQL